MLPDTTTESCIFFVWPLDIVHVINESSPFYNMTAEDLARERFELLIVMEGTNETSNMTFQARWGTAASQDPPTCHHSGPATSRARSCGATGSSRCSSTGRTTTSSRSTSPHSTPPTRSVRWVTLSSDTCAQVDTPRYSARHLDQLITRDRENQLKKTRTSLQQELQRLVRER